MKEYAAPPEWKLCHQTGGPRYQRTGAAGSAFCADAPAFCGRPLQRLRQRRGLYPDCRCAWEPHRNLAHAVFPTGSGPGPRHALWGALHHTVGLGLPLYGSSSARGAGWPSASGADGGGNFPVLRMRACSAGDSHGAFCTRGGESPGERRARFVLCILSADAALWCKGAAGWCIASPFAAGGIRDCDYPGGIPIFGRIGWAGRTARGLKSASQPQLCEKDGDLPRKIHHQGSDRIC